MNGSQTIPIQLWLSHSFCVTWTCYLILRLWMVKQRSFASLPLCPFAEDVIICSYGGVGVRYGERTKRNEEKILFDFPSK